MEWTTAEAYKKLLPELNERERRLYLGTEALRYGYGGVSKVHMESGVSRKTIRKGKREIEQGIHSKRIRMMGGGRKKIEYTQPGITEALKKLLKSNTKGDPMRLLRWTNKSVDRITEALKQEGYTISAYTVYYLLRKEGYSMKANKKNIEGKLHKDRNAQFEHINEECERFLSSNNPIISIDCKKKELIGNFKNNGKKWEAKGEETIVNTYDFTSLADGHAAPYGVFDILHKKGFVNVGIDHDTAAFAVESIRRWWRSDGIQSYPKATGILITADGGGSNGVRNRLFKKELQQFVNEIHIPITLCHFPPAMSKWNVIEHQLFAFITNNWKAQPLTSLAVILELISRTTTKSGLTVTAVEDTNTYPIGIKVTDKEMIFMVNGIILSLLNN